MTFTVYSPLLEYGGVSRTDPCPHCRYTLSTPNLCSRLYRGKRGASQLEGPSGIFSYLRDSEPPRRVRSVRRAPLACTAPSGLAQHSRVLSTGSTSVATPGCYANHCASWLRKPTLNRLTKALWRQFCFMLRNSGTLHHSKCQDGSRGFRTTLRPRTLHLMLS